MGRRFTEKAVGGRSINNVHGIERVSEWKSHMLWRACGQYHVGQWQMSEWYWQGWERGHWTIRRAQGRGRRGVRGGVIDKRVSGRRACDVSGKVAP